MHPPTLTHNNPGPTKKVIVTNVQPMQSKEKSHSPIPRQDPAKKSHTQPNSPTSSQKMSHSFTPTHTHPNTNSQPTSQSLTTNPFQPKNVTPTQSHTYSARTFTMTRTHP